MTGPVTISERSKITLGFLLGVMSICVTITGAVVVGVRAMTQESRETRDEFNRNFNSLRGDVGNLQRTVQSLSDEKWTEPQMAAWALWFKLMNGDDVEVPNPSNPSSPLPNRKPAAPYSLRDGDSR